MDALQDSPSDYLDQCVKDWTDLSNEYADLEELHAKYKSKLAETLALQKKCLSSVNHQRYRLNAISSMLRHVKGGGEHIKEEKQDLQKDLLRREAQLSQMEETLPKASGLYLKIILGSVNVSILDKDARYNYKDQYEQFKLIVNMIGCVLACSNLYFNNRLMDILFMFLIVWYFCTLTIRESILKVNGSRIKGWWRAHHFISTVFGGVVLIWPDGSCYQAFRNQLMWFNVYLAFVQYLQFTYQRGCLYRLKSLGQRKEMDITIDGFHSWMWKGLGFLLPFLYLGYLWQLYNSYTLYQLTFSEDATWHVACLTIIFLVLGLGNLITTSVFIPSKMKEIKMGELKLRFTRLDKYFWSHKRSRDAVLQPNRFSEGMELLMKRRNSRMEAVSPALDVLKEQREEQEDKKDT